MATWNLIEDGAQFAGLPDNVLSQGGYNDIGPIKYNGNLYVAGIRVQTNVAQPYPKKVAVYKSTDSGATWTPLDTANAPSCLASAADSDSTHIYFAYSNSVSQPFPWETRLVVFDLATETWGAPITGGPNSAGYFSFLGRYFSIKRLSNGDLWIFYPVGTISVGADSVMAVKYDGSWGSPITVATGIIHSPGHTRENYLFATAVDHLDRIYIIIKRTDTSAPTLNAVYNTLLAGALSGEVSIATNNIMTWVQNGVENLTDGTMNVPLIFSTGATDIGLLKIDTTSLAHTVEDVGNADSGFGVVLPWVANDGTNLYVFAEELNNSTTESALIYYSRPLAGGSWTYTLFSDSNTDPLPDPNVGLPWESGSTTVTFFGSGTFGVVGAYGLITACGVLFFALSAPPVPGSCPLTVGPGGGGGGTDCTTPATNPALDSYLELRKVLVAWKKETHLPVRGKS